VPNRSAAAVLIVFVVAVVTAVQIVATMATLGLAVLAPLAAESMGLPATLVGLQVSVIYIGAVITSGGGGVAVRRFGPCRTSQIALAFIVAGTLLIASGWPPALLSGSMLLGFAYGLTNPAASEILLRVVPPHRRNLLFSIKQTGVPLGGVMVSLTLPILALFAGWQVAIATVGALAALLVVLLQPLRSSWDAERTPGGRLGFGALLTGPRLLLTDPFLGRFGLGCFFLGFVQLSLASFVVTLLVLEMGFGLAQAGALAATMHVSGVVGRIGWGMLADRLRDGGLTMVLITSVMVLGFVVLPTLDADSPRALVVGVLVVLGATALGWNGIFLAEVARRSPPGRVGDSTGAILFATFGGVVVGPSMMSAAVALTGSHSKAFLICALASGLALVFILRVVRR